MQRNTSNKRNRNRKTKNPRKRGGKNQENGIVKLTQQGRFAPSRLFVNLVWNDTTFSRGHTGFNAMNWAYRSSAYDPDPAILTGAIPGFAEISTMYLAYRVHKMKMFLQGCHRETDPVIFVAWPSNVGANVNSLLNTDLMEYSSNKGGRTYLQGLSGSPPVSFQTVASGMDLIGPPFLYDLDYSASTSGNPNELFWINVGATCSSGNFSNPVALKSHIVYTVEFFTRATLES